MWGDIRCALTLPHLMQLMPSKEGDRVEIMRGQLGKEDPSPSWQQIQGFRGLTGMLLEEARTAPVEEGSRLMLWQARVRLDDSCRELTIPIRHLRLVVGLGKS